MHYEPPSGKFIEQWIYMNLKTPATGCPDFQQLFLHSILDMHDAVKNTRAYLSMSAPGGLKPGLLYGEIVV